MAVVEVNLVDGIYSHLTADNTFNTVVGGSASVAGRLYHGQGPTDPTAPYAVYFIVDTVDVEYLRKRQPARGKRTVQALPVDQLHGEEVRTALLLDGVDGHDVRVVQRSDRLRLALEAFQPGSIRGHLRWEDLQRHLALEPGVLGQKDRPHAALADPALDAVVGQCLSRLKGHGHAPRVGAVAAVGAMAAL